MRSQQGTMMQNLLRYCLHAASRVLTLCVILLSTGCQPAPPRDPAKAGAYLQGPILIQNQLNDFTQWKIEAEQPGTIAAQNGILSINVFKGCTVWFQHELTGPVEIQYEARL